VSPPSARRRQPARALFVLGGLTLGAAWGCEGSPAGNDVNQDLTYPTDGVLAHETASALPYTVVVMPDTQYYAASFPQIFDAQTRWIAAEKSKSNVAFVIHEGDLVDSDAAVQWQRASASMSLLDGLVPYVISAGNHDYDYASGWISGRSTMIDAYFPVSRFSQQTSFQGTLDVAHIENNYALFDISPGGGQWLVVSLEFGPRDQVLAWANDVVQKYASTPTIIVTHAYLYEDNLRYDHLAHSQQRWNPHAYPIEKLVGGVNDGEEIWSKLIAGNSNIRFVLCGHVLDSGVGLRTDVRPDGTVVHQILANYQTLPEGGGGFLRLMQFSPADSVVHVRTYSPYLETYKTDPSNQFDLSY
jgi:Calcineurin-like phosphoesterase